MRNRGFTLIELLVVVAVIAVLAGLLFPIFVAVREKARQTQCISNLNQIDKAFALYANDQDEMLPYRPTDLTGHPGGAGVSPTGTWPPLVIPPWTAQVEGYIKNRQIFVCPSTRRDWSWPLWAGSWGVLAREGPWLAPCGFRGYGSAVGKPEWDVFVSYGYNEAISNNFGGYISLATYRFESEFGLLADSEAAWFTPFGVGTIWGLSPSGLVQRIAFPEIFPPPAETDLKAHDATRHQNGSFIAFVDGHVKWVLWSQVRCKRFGGHWRFAPEDER
ncbi:MAG: prepilin-type N-terminal cleavage/methylation domain-containing protein [Armatimonadetes bacterium]|nr:prepilin-type N-terminal cleavage/methylation domain-containing protein [Armatimonadota bacterium]MDW8026847.1 prepilin-type N-terminal cleavage/methylation domain-containing protein [Armatimonadota bacterium]